MVALAKKIYVCFAYIPGDVFCRRFVNFSKKGVIVKKAVFMAAAALFVAGAQAQMYGELGYTSTEVKLTDTGDTYKAKPAAIRGIVGYDLHPNVAVEGMLAFGTGSADVSGPNVAPGANVKIKDAYGLFVKPKTKVNDALEVFGRIGYTQIKYQGGANGVSPVKETEDGLSYGVGLSYALTRSVSLNLDYLQYVKTSDAKATGATFGVGFRF